jgi:hypothetical protein
LAFSWFPELSFLSLCWLPGLWLGSVREHLITLLWQSRHQEGCIDHSHSYQQWKSEKATVLSHYWITRPLSINKSCCLLCPFLPSALSHGRPWFKSTNGKF